jgi:hypothetical protein
MAPVPGPAGPLPRIAAGTVSLLSAPAAVPTAAPEPLAPDETPTPSPETSDGPALEQIEAAISAALGQAPARPDPAPRPEPARTVVPDPEPAAVAVLPALPVRLPTAAPDPASAPKPVASTTEAPRSSAGEALDPASPVTDTEDEDDSPIFRALRSHWLTPDGDGVGGWTSPEIDAGWEAADRSAAPAAAQVSEAGLPMRRPGNRLEPGGVSSAASVVSRDPEAIRARLSAHSAGVARGRREAVDATGPEPPGQEATTQPAPRQEAGTP